MQRVINFSGGKTSAYMTILEYKKGDIVLFCDTGREHPKTYKFINDFEAFEKIPVTRITYELDGLTGFDAMYKHQKYKKIPNRMKRICTLELKVYTAKRWLRKKGIRTFCNLVGFRYDEQKRILGHKDEFKNVITLFPLNDMKVTKEIVNTFWDGKEYNLEIPRILGNCDLCFLKGKNVIIQILREHPELAHKWINDEEESAKKFGHTYFPETTYKELLRLSKLPYFKQQNLFEIEPAFNCACTA